MNQVMQVGDTSGDIQYYIEDYAYTYLKKQKGREKTKYFLYGEKEDSEKPKKLYIYGVAPKPKMEQTYFKDYYPLGFLKTKNDEKYWISLKGQEEKVNGFFVFYASNQAMQEYLVDCHEEIKEDEPEKKSKRQLPEDILPVKEIVVPARKIKIRKKAGEKNSISIPFMGIAVAMILLLVLTSANGQQKLGIFKQVIKETMGNVIEEIPEEDMIIEEKRAGNAEEDAVIEEKRVENAGEVEEPEDLSETKDWSIEEKEITKEENLIPEKTEILQNEEPVLQDKEPDLQEYIVKEGDTLAAICRKKYGTLSNMQEICTINNIKNADYIAPGQKLYLP